MATIAEKSRTKEIIDRLQGIIDGASAVPLAPGKISVYKDEIQNLLTELATQMENELKTYHEVNDRRGKLISEAKKEAEKIIYQAEHSASRMRVSRHTTDVAPLDFESLDEEERIALGNANEIYGASLIYTDEMLTEVSEMISTAYQNIRSDYEIILQVFEEKLSTITSNREELMAGLQEMDDADRSQQILEIGQLLSSELHMSRMKAKMNPDVYKDGSIQLTLDLQLEQEEEKTRQAEEKAQQTAEALAEMTAERDALAATVEKLKKDNVKEDQASATASNVVEFKKDVDNENTPEPDEEYEIVYVTEDELEEGEEYEIEYVDDESEEDVEYEIVYVTEDELEEGEEYEIEYVDEDEEIVDETKESADEVEEPIDEDIVNEEEETVDNEEAADKRQNVKREFVKRDTAKTFFVKAEDKKSSEKAEDEKPGHRNLKSEKPERRSLKSDKLEPEKSEKGKLPLVPRFKKSESVASVPSERIAKMAEVITTDKKYSGLIGGAVKPSADEEVISQKDKSVQESESAKDEDIKTDKDGKEYVEAQMEFSEDYEIMEF